MASRLHRHLLDRFGCSLGLLEPLRLDPNVLQPDWARDLESRFLQLDPAEGHAPEALPGKKAPPLRRQTAIGWLAAGGFKQSAILQGRRQHGGSDGGTGL